MLKNEFQSMIEQYSNELMNISRQLGEDIPVASQPTSAPRDETVAVAPTPMQQMPSQPIQPQNPSVALPSQPIQPQNPPSAVPSQPIQPQNPPSVVPSQPTQQPQNPQINIQPQPIPQQNQAPMPPSRQPRNIPNNNPVQIPPAILDEAGQYQDNSANMTYEQFLLENPGSGVLKVQVFSGQQVTPVPNAEVTVSKTFLDGEHVFFTGLTDISGIVDGIELPAPPRTISESPQPRGNGAILQMPYSQYNVMVKAARHRAQEYTHVPIFDGIKSIQPVRLTPIQFLNGENGTIVFPEAEPNTL